MCENFFQDLRYGLRTMRRDAGFCAVAVLILGLGIGANTAIFSVVNTVLFRPLPFRDPARLVWIANTGTGGSLSSVTSRVSTYRDWRAANQSFEDLTAYFAFSDYGSVTLMEAGEPERLQDFGVAQNFFDVLGVHPALGRGFDSEEAKWNGRKAVILTHGLWERRFGSDPRIIGRAITLNDQATTVVGVMPMSFDFASVFAPGSKVDMLTPFAISDETDRWGNTLTVIGRLKPGATVRKAQAEFDLIVQQLRRAHPERGGFGARLTSLQEQISGRFRRALMVLLCAVGAVLLIVCANLSNLLLARAASRRKEIAVRTALGASRARLIRQMMTESMVLAGAGAALGLALAYTATRALAGLHAMSIPLLQTVKVDGAALGYTALVAVATGLLFGIAPALQVSGLAVHDGLKESSRGSSEGRRGAWLRGALVVSEIALACVLLVGAGLLIRSFVRVLDVDLGFQPSRIAIWTIETGQKYRTGAQQAALYRELVQRVAAVPGVESAGVTDCLPLGRNRTWWVRAKGETYLPGQEPLGFPRIVDAGYIPTMKIPLRAGRNFTDHDTAQSEKVVVINQNLARRLWPGRDALGQIVLINGETRVVGVVGNVRHSSLEQEGGLEFYLPVTQAQSGSVELVVRTKLQPEALAPSVRAALRAVEPGLPTAEFRTLTDVVDRAVSPRRFVVLLLGGFAALALLLASLGIYGVVSYSVNQRAKEIGIRMALGASAGHVQLRVLRETVALALIGAMVGLAGSVGAARLLESLLFGVTPGDALTFLGMIAVLTSVAALAGYLPARRASRVDPMSALRSE
jgi:putative ABC transport system permease protein